MRVAPDLLFQLHERLEHFYACEQFEDLAAAAQQALLDLVAGDWASVSLGPALRGGARRFWSPRAAQQAALTPAARRFALQHPIWRHALAGHAPCTVSLRDLISHSRLEALDVYHEVLRPLNVDNILGVCLPLGLDLAISVSRPWNARVRPGELALLALLGTHTARAAWLLARRRQGMLRVRGADEPCVRMGIVVLGDGWRIRGLTPTAAILLRPLTGGDCGYVPAPLRPEPHATIGGVARCVAGDFVLESEVLEIEPGEARLILRAYPFSEHERLIARATTLGLTPRQAEIARWVAAGKTNREIAVLLQISSQTVKKHVENILRRVGVENRLALASLLLTGP